MKQLRFILMFVFCSLIVGCSNRENAATPSTAPIEPISYYLGNLEGSEDVIALLVSTTRFRAAICSDDEERWQQLDTWISDGLVADRMLTSSRVTAQRGDGVVQGNYSAKDGALYSFSARMIAMTEDYRTGEERAIYWQPAALLPDSTAVDFYAVVADVETSAICAMLLQDGQPRSRVKLIGTWQEGFSIFQLTDVPDEGGKPVVWVTPRLLNRIIGIALPTPLPTP